MGRREERSALYRGHLERDQCSDLVAQAGEVMDRALGTRERLDRALEPDRARNRRLKALNASKPQWDFALQGRSGSFSFWSEQEARGAALANMLCRLALGRKARVQARKRREYFVQEWCDRYPDRTRAEVEEACDQHYGPVPRVEDEESELAELSQQEERNITRGRKKQYVFRLRDATDEDRFWMRLLERPSLTSRTQGTLRSA